MSAEHLTLADLRAAGLVTSLEIVAAIEAYIRNPAAGPYRAHRNPLVIDPCSGYFDGHERIDREAVRPEAHPRTAR